MLPRLKNGDRLLRVRDGQMATVYGWLSNTTQAYNRPCDSPTGKNPMRVFAGVYKVRMWLQNKWVQIGVAPEDLDLGP